MSVYFITIFILFAFAIIEVVQVDSQKRKLFSVLSYLILVIVIGLRWETGTDWNAYLETFSYSGNYDDLTYYFSGMEYGYLLLNFFVFKISENYSFFLFLHALIYYALIIKSFYKLVPYPQIAILLFFCINIGITGSNRQLLAVSLCMIGLTYLVIQKKKPFFLYILGGVFFHTTAALFVVYYFFNRHIKSVYLYGIILVSVVIGSTSLPTLLFSLFGVFGGVAEEKTKIYIEVAGDGDEALTLLGLVKRLLFVLVFIVLRNKVEIKSKLYNLFLNGYIFGVAFYFIFASTLLIMVNRGSIYFNIMDSLLLSLIMLMFTRKIDKILYLLFLLLLGIALFYQSISAYPDLFDPYKGLFINSDYYRRMY